MIAMSRLRRSDERDMVECTEPVRQTSAPNRNPSAWAMAHAALTTKRAHVLGLMASQVSMSIRSAYLYEEHK